MSVTHHLPSAFILSKSRRDIRVGRNVTAWDIDIDGSMRSGTETTHLHGAKDLQTIGLGGTSKDMHIADAELRKFTTSGGLRIGGFTGDVRRGGYW